MSRPPRLAERLLGFLLPAEEREPILGDLEEAFQTLPRGLGRVVWYWGQVVLLGAVLTPERLRRRASRAVPPGREPSGRQGVHTGGGVGMTMGEMATTVARETKITLRGLVRRPGYALLAIITLVLGVGAVTASYGLLTEVVLRPLPYGDVDRLVAIRTLYDSDALGLTEPEYQAVARSADTFESVAALVEPHLDEDWIWTGREEPRPLAAVRVTDAFFTTLRVTPEVGTLVGGESPGERRLVLSHGLWSALGGDPSVVGGSLEINGRSYLVTGVLPAAFEFPLGTTEPEAWILHTPAPAEAGPDLPLAYRGIARLAPGVGIEGAEQQLARIVGELRTSLGDSPGSLLVRPLQTDLTGSAGRALVLLTLSGLLVLLVASVNLSFLMASRNAERREELNVRAALGASRGSLLRHLLTEAGILAVAGGAGAVLVALVAVRGIAEGRIAGLERLSATDIGGGLVAVAVAASLVPALVAAVLPALRASTAVRGLGSRGGSASAARKRSAWILTGVESCMVFALLATAALVLRSLDAVTSVDPGFDTESTLAVTAFRAPASSTPSDGSDAFLTTMEERLGAIPGVDAVGAISNLPLSSESWAGSLVIDGRDDVGTETGGTVVVDWELVSPGYFDAIGIPLLQGRSFDEGDRADAPGVVIINQSLARRWWPDSSPIGARISGGGPLRTVVGVVGDVKQQGLHAGTRGFMYLPQLQVGSPAKQEIVVRVRGADPATVTDRVRTALLETEPGIAIAEVRTLDVLVAEASGPFRLRAILLGAFAAMALLLGTAGIYGVTAHGVRVRSRETGIRMAMGADADRVAMDVVFHALAPVGAGLVVGVALLIVAGPLLRGFLFGVAPTDPLALLVIALVLMAGALAAVAPPTLRARRTDPVAMLTGD